MQSSFGPLNDQMLAGEQDVADDAIDFTNETRLQTWDILSCKQFLVASDTTERIIARDFIAVLPRGWVLGSSLSNEQVHFGFARLLVVVDSLLLFWQYAC
jgi:hypothetical protein